MDAKLVVVGGEAKAAQIQLKLPTIIGRGREATLTLPHPLVSRRHCEIFESNGQLMVRDLASLNGTFINNKRIGDEAVLLRPRELLTVGVVTFRAIYGEAVADDSQSPSSPRSAVGSSDQTVYSPREANPISQLPPRQDPAVTENEAPIRAASDQPPRSNCSCQAADKQETEALASDTDMPGDPPPDDGAATADSSEKTDDALEDFLKGVNEL